MKSRNPILVEVVRGHAVESQHQVMAVVAESRGLITSYWGNTDFVTYPRSAIKSLQALVLVESGAMEKFGLDERMLALACASHVADKVQMSVLKEWMEKIKVTEANLVCGACYPAHEGTHHEMVKKGLGPSSVCHNCSGKHLGLISACMALGEDIKNYHHVDHPIQVRLRKVLSELMKCPLDKFPPAIDGCGIPTYAVPLQNVAIGMSSFFNQKEIVGPRRQALSRILQAWKNNPQLVSRSEDFASTLAEKTKGRALLKSGAEGVYCGLMPEKGLAFVVKTADGAKRASEIVSGMIFKTMGALTDVEFNELKTWTTPALLNSRGEAVGTIKIAGTSI